MAKGRSAALAVAAMLVGYVPVAAVFSGQWWVFIVYTLACTAAIGAGLGLGPKGWRSFCSIPVNITNFALAELVFWLAILLAFCLVVFLL